MAGGSEHHYPGRRRDPGTQLTCAVVIEFLDCKVARGIEPTLFAAFGADHVRPLRIDACHKIPGLQLQHERQVAVAGQACEPRRSLEPVERVDTLDVGVGYGPRLERNYGFTRSSTSTQSWGDGSAGALYVPAVGTAPMSCLLPLHGLK